MASAVDSTFPADNTKVSKATFRAQMLIIKNEITALQQRTSVAGTQAFNAFVDEAEVRQIVNSFHDSQGDVIRDMAFGRVSMTSND